MYAYFNIFLLGYITLSLIEEWYKKCSFSISVIKSLLSIEVLNPSIISWTPLVIGFNSLLFQREELEVFSLAQSLAKNPFIKGYFILSFFDV